MKYRLIIAALSLSTVAVALPGCAQLGSMESVATTPLCSHTLVDDKAYFGVIAAYNGVVGAYVSADKRGLLKDPLRSQLRGDTLTMRKYRDGAKAAYDVCNHDSLFPYQDAMSKLSDKVLPLIPH